MAASNCPERTARKNGFSNTQNYYTELKYMQIILNSLSLSLSLERTQLHMLKVLLYVAIEAKRQVCRSVWNLDHVQT